MAKYGSPSVGFLVVDGYDLLGSDVLSITAQEVETVLELTHGLGKTMEESTPTGLMRGAFGHEGYYDDAVGSVNDALATKEQTQRIVCLSLTGNTVGAKFVGYAGAFAGKYSRLVNIGALHKAKADYTVSGAVENGIVLQEFETKTVDWNTEGADSVDHGASSAAGGSAYLQIRTYTGFTGFVAKVRHSADDVTYADLATFANATAIGAQRVTVAGTVNRHLAADGNVTGAGTIEVMIGFARG
jgi:hypothetical protein